MAFTWTVKETKEKPTVEPVGTEYNCIVLNTHGKTYKVTGPPFCFVGYSLDSMKRKCIKMVDAHLEGVLEN